MYEAGGAGCPEGETKIAEKEKKHFFLKTFSQEVSLHEKENVVYKVFKKQENNKKAMFHFKNENYINNHLRVKHGYTFVPEIYETHTRDDDYIIKMEYAGVDLCELYLMCQKGIKYTDEYTKTTTTLDSTWWTFNVEHICSQIRAIVTAMHKAGVVHLDIKPENFVCDLTTKKLKIIDFSGSLIPEDEPDMELYLKYSQGTTSYMSPEFVLEQDRSKSSDIWSTATTLYTLQTGRNIPGTTQIMINRMMFDDEGNVYNEAAYFEYFTKIINYAKPLIERNYSYNPEIASLGKFFVKKELRPTTL